MENKVISGVSLRKVNGKVELHVPTAMTGKALQKWLDKNGDVLQAFKDDSADDADDDSDSIGLA